MGQPQNEEILKDMAEGIAQAEEMNANMLKHGTIDVPAEEAERMRRQQLIEDAVNDGRKLVTVREISAIDDIPGADLIKVAQVEGWKVVVKAGEFQPGDKCVFFEVDSYLPMDDERYKFLEKNATNWQGIPGARLKTIRLRKQLSQGLALPVRDFPEVHPFLESEELRDINFTGALGIMKWEQVINAQLAGQAKGSFPSFLRKSDQERCQNMGAQIFGYEDTHATEPLDVTGIPEDAILAMLDKGELIAIGGKIIDGVDVPNYYKVRKAQASRDTKYEVTLKMDGSSMTVYTRGDDITGEITDEGVCSRNLDLKMEGNEDNAFVKMAQSGLLDILKHTRPNLALQGELMGPGIQGNRENFPANRFFIYNIFDIKAGEFLTPDERKKIVNAMQTQAVLHEINFVVEHVPTLHNWVTLEELNIHNLDDLLKFAIGPSLNNNVREGVVFKAMDGSQQFKAISNLYLEQEK